MKYYILEGKEPLLIFDPVTWGHWLQTSNRYVCKTDLPEGFTISTIFLGLDHSVVAGGEPILFETMVFDDYQSEPRTIPNASTRRYATWEEAEAGHAEIVALVQAWIEDVVEQKWASQ